MRSGGAVQRNCALAVLVSRQIDLAQLAELHLHRLNVLRAHFDGLLCLGLLVHLQ